MQEHGGTWQGFVTQFSRFPTQDLGVIILSNARAMAPVTLAPQLAALVDSTLAMAPPPSIAIADREPAITTAIRTILGRIADEQLELSDFEVVRQTIFPRLRAQLIGTLRGKAAPTKMELLARREIGDDVERQYFAWYGADRYRVVVTLGPLGKLTGLRVTPEQP
jgi:hypothetical protein